MIETRSIAICEAVASEVSLGKTIPAESRRVFFFQIAGVAILFVFVLVSFARWRTGAFSAVLPYLSGQRLIFETSQLEFGTVKLGIERVDMHIRIVNSGVKGLRLLGAHRSCGCISLDEFPLEIAAGSVRSLKVSVGMPNAESAFHHFVKFFSDDPVKSSELITINGSVR